MVACRVTNQQSPTIRISIHHIPHLLGRLRLQGCTLGAFEARQPAQIPSTMKYQPLWTILDPNLCWQSQASLMHLMHYVIIYNHYWPEVASMNTYERAITCHSAWPCHESLPKKWTGFLTMSSMSSILISWNSMKCEQRRAAVKPLGIHFRAAGGTPWFPGSRISGGNSNESSLKRLLKVN